jgi:hypothetical protein
MSRDELLEILALADLPVTVFASIGYGFFSCVDTAAADATRSYDGI